MGDPEAAAGKAAAELLIEALTIESVDEGVVAGVAHRKQVTGEPDQVDVLVRVDGRVDLLQDVVRLEGEPADCEDRNHDQQHLDHLF